MRKASITTTRGLARRSFFGFAILVSHCLLAQPFFFRKDIRVAERPPVGVAAGDLNGDGRPDLAVSTSAGVLVHLNQGGGNFGRPILAATDWAGNLTVGDFNGDGKDDLVSSSGMVLLSRGDGTFLPLPLAEKQSPWNVLAAADFNRDGKSDLLVIGPFGSSILLSNTDGTFQSPLMVLTNSSAVVADFNRDGRPDLAAQICDEPVPGCSSPISPRHLSILLGKGDGTFDTEIRTPLDVGGPPEPGLLLAADFNGDGLPGLATPSGILLGKGDGRFRAPVPYPRDFGAIGTVQRLLAAADFTGDGYADLVVGYKHSPAKYISIYPGKGGGTLLPAVEQPVGWNYLSFVTRLPEFDLDGDGRRDLVVPALLSNTITLLMSRSQGGGALARALSTASETAIVAPESLATLMTATTTSGSNSASPPWPTRLGGIILEVRDSMGASRPAPLIFVSPTQVSFQVPAGTALGEATLAIVSDGGTSQAGSMQVDAVAPGLFMASHASGIPAATAVRIEPDGAQVPIPVFSCSGTACHAEPIPLSAGWSRPIYLSFFGTGFRGANPGNVTCSIYGIQVPVVYAGPQGTPGVDQINVRLTFEFLNGLLNTLPFVYEGVAIRMNGEEVARAWIEIE